jgi:hypothetical protein
VRIANAAISVRSHLDGVYYFGKRGESISLLSTSKPHLFSFTRCGTKPRRAVVGALREKTVEAAEESTAILFNICAAGSRRAGTYPKQATIGAAVTRETTTEANSLAYTFGFVRCGTRRCGQL